MNLFKVNSRVFKYVYFIINGMTENLSSKYKQTKWQIKFTIAVHH